MLMGLLVVLVFSYFPFLLVGLVLFPVSVVGFFLILILFRNFVLFRVFVLFLVSVKFLVLLLIMAVFLVILVSGFFPFFTAAFLYVIIVLPVLFGAFRCAKTAFTVRIWVLFGPSVRILPNIFITFKKWLLFILLVFFRFWF